MLWGAPIEDARGIVLAEWAAELDLCIANKGSVPTFRRGNQKSHVDVTMCSQKVNARIEGWEVSEAENLSDHQDIYFVLKRSWKLAQHENKAMEMG